MVVHTTDVLCGTNPEEGPRRLPGLLEPPELFHGGPPLRFPEGGWYLAYPPHSGDLGEPGKSRGSSSASGSRGVHGDAGGRSAIDESATGVIHKRPRGWSSGDRLRARVDNPERGRGQPEERRSGLTGIRTPEEAEPAVFEFIAGWYNTRRCHSALNVDRPSSMNRGTGVSTKTQAQTCPPKRGRSKRASVPGIKSHPLSSQLRDLRQC